MFGQWKVAPLSLAVLSLALSGCTGASSSGLAKELHDAYNDLPYRGGQLTPDHEWAQTDAEHLVFLHWMPTDSQGKETGGDTDKADVLFATGDGFKARWCKGAGGITQAQIDAGYVHFHKETAAEWNAGHGGDTKAQVGYWLRHVAARSGVDMMPGVTSQAGKVYPLMPSTSGLPDC